MYICKNQFTKEVILADIEILQKQEHICGIENKYEVRA